LKEGTKLVETGGPGGGGKLKMGGAANLSRLGGESLYTETASKRLKYRGNHRCGEKSTSAGSARCGEEGNQQPTRRSKEWKKTHNAKPSR